MTPDELRDTIERISTQAVQATTQLSDKPWWQSRTIWGAIIVLVSQIALLFDIAIDVNAMTESALAFATLIGAVLAWWGRLQSTQPISREQVLPGLTRR